MPKKKKKKKETLFDCVFTHRDKKYKLLDILDENDFFIMKDVEKPIIKKPGFVKLMKYFNFIITDHDISYDNDHTMFDFKQYSNSKVERKCIGKTCSVVITLLDPATYTDEEKTKYKDPADHFQGDGEANFLNTTGIGQLYLQAMAKKRAMARAILDYLGIDAYSEDESYDFKNYIQEATVLKKYISNQIVDMASGFEIPLENEDLRKYIREHCELGSNDTFSTLSVEQLFELLLHMYDKLPEITKNAYHK